MSCVLDDQRTHLIVGGTGGLGRSMTRWMIGQGARHIVLVSRSGSRDIKVQQFLDEVHGTAAVQVIVCDISDEEQVRRLFDRCDKTMPPICGVVNAAMALHVRHPPLLPGLSSTALLKSCANQNANRTACSRT